MRIRHAAIVMTCLVASGTWTPLASAADAGVPRSDQDVSTLEASIGEQWTQLSSDCTTACRALQSIQRAADRICELEPGVRCDRARSKADDAARRVHASCPECVLAQTPKKGAPAEDKDEERAMAKPRSTADEHVVTAQSAPPSESGRGGCRSCDASGASPGDLFQVGAFAALVARVLRRRKRR